MSAGAAIARSSDSAGREREAPADPALAIIEKFRLQKSVFICAEGRSMWPSIRPRDIVFVQRAGMNQVCAGHIVAFARENRVIIHRVLSRMQESGAGDREEVLLTKGDALDGADFPVSREEFLGRVTRIHRGRRHIDLESMMRQCLGRFVALLSPFSRFFYNPLRCLRDFHRTFFPPR
jgi:signal peptidase I